MKLEISGDTLRVLGVKELGAANANAFRDWVRDGLTNGEKNIEIDLSEATFLDSCGLGALVALQKTARSRKGTLRLRNPQPQVQQLLGLTRLDKIFEVCKG